MLKYQWTNGTSPERSLRSQKPVPIVSSQTKEEQVVATNASSVVDPCMMASPSQNMMLNQSYLRNMDNQEPNREDTNFMIAERDMMPQSGKNPFFSFGNPNTDSYADQVSLQDKFLKPMSTIYTDKAKSNEDKQFQIQ